MNPPFSIAALFTGIFGLIAVAALFAWTSRINQFFFFARTLPRAFVSTPEARTITFRYIGMIFIGAGLAILTLTLLYTYQGLSTVVSLVSGLLVEVVTFHLAFAVSHHAAGIAFSRLPAQHDKSTAGPAENKSQDRTIAISLLGKTPTTPIQRLFAPALLATCFWFGGFATADGTLAHFTEQACAQGGAFLLGLACGITFSGVAVRLMMRFSARQRTPLAEYIDRVMAFLSWLAAAIIGGVVLATRAHHAVTRTATHYVLVAILVLVAAHIIYLWSSRKFTPPAAEHDGDQHWRAGLFYYNQQDPALFVQRRSGPGYTLNFGNIFSWPITAFILADFAFILIARHHM